MDKVKNLGQVYTPTDIVKIMVGLIKNNGNILEPSCGDGAFTSYIKDNTSTNITSIEIDPDNDQEGFTIMDFFDYDINNKFQTIIGNPPYVSFKSIGKDTLNKIQGIDYLNSYDNRTNLFIFFIRKCIEHLSENGEIIFITPREFIKSTSSIKLNNYLHQMGTITHWYEYGDKVVFKGYSPTVAIWRFQKNNFSRITETFNGIKKFDLNSGQISFIDDSYNVKLSDIFFVKVGAVSGKDNIFTSEFGNKDFVCSYTKSNGKLKKMFYNIKSVHLEKHIDILVNRKIKKFNMNNWWQWGRGLYESEEPRIYVNCKTRDKNPFFTNDCKFYDGSVLAIFPKKSIDINLAVQMLNKVNWDELGFKVGGRMCFSQKALENTNLPNEFKCFIDNKN